MCVFDNYVSIGGAEQRYESLREWIVRDGVPQITLS